MRCNKSRLADHDDRRCEFATWLLAGCPELAGNLPATYQSAIVQAKTLPSGRAISYHKG
jgi:hypothetical protein